MMLIPSVTDTTVNLQDFANADSLWGKKQVTDYINLTVDLCTWALVRVGGGWGVLPVGIGEAYQHGGIRVDSIWSNFRWLKHKF